MKTSIAIIVALVLIFSCKKETGVAGPQGPAGNQGANNNSNDTGSIAGKLRIYDEFSNPKNDFSGAIVSISSGSFAAQGTTDATGSYHFYGLHTGTYNITYEKPGYGTYKVFGLSHIPTGELQTVVPDQYLLQVPVKTAIDRISLMSTAFSYSVHINLDTSSMSYVQYSGNFMMLMGKHANVNPSDYIRKVDQISPDGIGGYSFSSSLSATRPYFNPGDTLYIRVGTYNRYINGSSANDYTFDLGGLCYYIDPSNGNYVYPNLIMSSDVIQIVL